MPVEAPARRTACVSVEYGRPRLAYQSDIITAIIVGSVLLLGRCACQRFQLAGGVPVTAIHPQQRIPCAMAAPTGTKFVSLL
jgi:hypothetical protein